MEKRNPVNTAKSAPEKDTYNDQPRQSVVAKETLVMSVTETLAVPIIIPTTAKINNAPIKQKKQETAPKPSLQWFISFLHGQINIRISDMNKKKPPITAIEIMIFQCMTLSGWEIPSSVMEKEHDVTDDAQI